MQAKSAGGIVGLTIRTCVVVGAQLIKTPKSAIQNRGHRTIFHVKGIGGLLSDVFDFGGGGGPVFHDTTGDLQSRQGRLVFALEGFQFDSLLDD